MHLWSTGDKTSMELSYTRSVRFREIVKVKEAIVCDSFVNAEIHKIFLTRRYIGRSIGELRRSPSGKMLS